MLNRSKQYIFNKIDLLPTIILPPKAHTFVETQFKSSATPFGIIGMIAFFLTLIIKSISAFFFWINLKINGTTRILVFKRYCVKFLNEHALVLFFIALIMVNNIIAYGNSTYSNFALYNLDFVYFCFIVGDLIISFLIYWTVLICLINFLFIILGYLIKCIIVEIIDQLNAFIYLFIISLSVVIYILINKYCCFIIYTLFYEYSSIVKKNGYIYNKYHNDTLFEKNSLGEIKAFCTLFYLCFLSIRLGFLFEIFFISLLDSFFNEHFLFMNPIPTGGPSANGSSNPLDPATRPERDRWNKEFFKKRINQPIIGKFWHRHHPESGACCIGLHSYNTNNGNRARFMLSALQRGPYSECQIINLDFRGAMGIPVHNTTVPVLVLGHNTDLHTKLDGCTGIAIYDISMDGDLNNSEYMPVQGIKKLFFKDPPIRWFRAN